MIPSLEIPAIAEMAQLRQWVGFRASDKAPLAARGGFAEVDDPDSWTDFGTAARMAAMHEPVPADGMGFVFAENDEFTGIDLDQCGDPRRGKLTPWAQSVVDRLPTFSEISLSGRGLHLITRGKAPRSCQLNKTQDQNRPMGGIYPVRRYFAMTGELFGKIETIEPAGGALLEILEEWEQYKGGPGRRYVGSNDLALLPHMPFTKFEATIEHDPTFRKSWYHRRHDLSDTSLSGYDDSLAILAARAGWSNDEIAGLLIAHREKYAGSTGKDPRKDLEKVTKRRDYLARTILSARDTLSENQRSGEPLKQTLARVKARETAEDAIEDGRAVSELRGRLGVPVSRVIITGIDTAVAYSMVLDDGRRVALGDAASLLSQMKFRQRVLAASNVVMKGAKQHEWDAVVRMLVAVAEREEAADSDPVKAMVDALEEYLDKHKPAAWDDAETDTSFARNMPVQRDGKPWVTIRHFHSWCMVKGGMAELRAEELRSILRQAGWSGEKLVRRLGPKVVSRFYWRRSPDTSQSDEGTTTEK